MVGIALVIVVIGIVTPTFKPEPRLIRDVERPGGVTVSLQLHIMITQLTM